MKVLLIHNKYQLAGGELAAVQAEIALLRRHRHQVVDYHRDSAEIDDFGLLQKALFFPDTVYSRRTYREVTQLAAAERPDLAHVHNVFPLVSPSVYMALRESRIPIVQTVHNYRLMCPNGLFYTHGRICERCKTGNYIHAIYQKCYRHSYLLSLLYAISIGANRARGTFRYIDRFLTLTAFSAQKLLESGLATQNQLVTLGHFLPDPLPFPGSPDARPRHVVYLGRLSPEKGIGTLLDAMVGLPDLQLKIAGVGPEMASLRASAKSRGLTSTQFLGHIEGERKWDLLREAYAVVVPSLCYETFGLAALESMSVATPVIASDLGSLPSLVEDGQCGLLFTAGNVDSLRRTLVWASEHPAEMSSMGKGGREVVEDRYSADSHYRQLISVYSSL